MDQHTCFFPFPFSSSFEVKLIRTWGPLLDLGLVVGAAVAGRELFCLLAFTSPSEPPPQEGESPARFCPIIFTSPPEHQRPFPSRGCARARAEWPPSAISVRRRSVEGKRRGKVGRGMGQWMGQCYLDGNNLSLSDHHQFGWCRVIV